MRRFQDCLHYLEDRFPEETPVWRFNLAKGEAGELDLGPIFRSLDEKYETAHEALDAYKRMPMTLHILGLAVGRPVFATVRALAGMPDVKLMACRGTQDEFDRAIADLNTCSALVLDESALATIFLLGVEDLLRRFPVPLVVSEGTVQRIRDLDTVHADPNRAGGILARRGNGYEHVELTPEAIATEKNRIESFLQVVGETCRVEGGAALANLSKDKRDKLVAIAGRPAAESLELAASTGRVLLTDDLILGDLARGFSRGSRAWTQAVLIWASVRGHCPPPRMAEASLHLLGMGYFWTRMWPGAVIYAARRSSWDSGRKPLSDALQHFADPSADVVSLTVLTGHSFVEILRSAPSGKAAYLMCCILDQLRLREGGGMCAETILAAARELQRRPDLEWLAAKIEVVLSTWFENCEKSGITIH